MIVIGTLYSLLIWLLGLLYQRPPETLHDLAIIDHSHDSREHHTETIDLLHVENYGTTLASNWIVRQVVGVCSVPLLHPICWLLQAIILRPLELLYLHGPDLGGYGFWNGKTLPEICSSLSGVGASFWQRHSFECQAIVQRRFFGNLVFLALTVYFWLIVRKVLFCIRQIV